jgi:hypothetical protein
LGNPWFRMYVEFADDPKVQMMPEAMQRRLLMLFCERGKGETLHETERAFHWRVTETELSETKALFMQKDFIDGAWNLLNWNKRQFLSDSSTDRVRRHRSHLKHDETLQEQSTAVTVTAPDTEQIQKQKQKRHTANGKPSPECVSLYQAYPRHVAPDTAYRAITKALARKPFAELLAAVTRFATQCRKDATEAQFIPHPATWFNAGRYDDGEVLPCAVRPKTQYELNAEAQLEERRQAIAAAGVVQ